MRVITIIETTRQNDFAKAKKPILEKLAKTGNERMEVKIENEIKQG